MKNRFQIINRTIHFFVHSSVYFAFAISLCLFVLSSYLYTRKYNVWLSDNLRVLIDTAPQIYDPSFWNVEYHTKLTKYGKQKTHLKMWTHIPYEAFSNNINVVNGIYVDLFRQNKLDMKAVAYVAYGRHEFFNGEEINTEGDVELPIKIFNWNMHYTDYTNLYKLDINDRSLKDCYQYIRSKKEQATYLIVNLFFEDECLGLVNAITQGNIKVDKNIYVVDTKQLKFNSYRDKDYMFKNWNTVKVVSENKRDEVELEYMWIPNIGGDFTKPEDHVASNIFISRDSDAGKVYLAKSLIFRVHGYDFLYFVSCTITAGLVFYYLGKIKKSRKKKLSRS